tara:strand:+ start:1669 stop:1965 length:297 start_codon:yes stop_codon:yes gene_type:complete
MKNKTQKLVLVLLALVTLYLLSKRFKKNVNSYTLYGYDSCPYTVKMHQELQKSGYDFEYKQIDKNKQYREEYKKYNVSGVPLTIDNASGEKIMGYRKM